MKKSLLGLGVAVTVIPVASMAVFIGVMGTDIVKTANAEFRSAAVDSSRQTLIDIRQMCDVIHMSDESFTAGARTSFIAAIADLGEVTNGPETAVREVRSQDNPTFPTEREMKLLKFGDVVADPAAPADKPDKLRDILNSLKSRFGCDFSVLARISEEGDMLCAASTVVSDAGDSLAGTYVSADVDGGINPIAASLLSGREYSGVVNVGGYMMSANYIPIRDEKSEVVGALFFGGKKNSIAELEKFLRNFNIGDTGSVWVVDDSNEDNPVLRIARDSSANGIYVRDDQSNARKAFLLQAVARCKLMRRGEITVEVVPMGYDKNAPVKIITYTYYAPWKWVIGTIADATEYSSSEAALRDQIHSLSREIVYAGVFFTILAIGLAWMLAARMSKPLHIMMRVASAHSGGDMSAAQEHLEKLSGPRGGVIKEFNELARSILEMTRNLSGLIMSVGRDGESVAERASRISEIASDLENISSMENSSMNRVVRTGGLITTSSEEINRAVRVSAAGVERTLSISRAGGENLSLLKRNHDALNAAADTVGRRLSVISGNAEKITELVTAINDVSRRTNLLSLNASVEAEKAGEAGLGFAVVARQIRKLADKASRASEDIEQIAKQLQSAVNSGVMEMDKFDSKMRQSSRVIIETANSLSRAIADIEAIGPKFDDIASRITILSEGATKVSATMVDLGSSSVRAVERISEFKSADSTLDSTAENLIGEVSLFKISDGKRGGK